MSLPLPISLQRSFTIALIAMTVAAAGCSTRVAGQVELFEISKEGHLQNFSRSTSFAASRSAIPKWSEPVRSNDDVIAIQVESVHLQELPFRVTGSHDVIVFADVWENSAMGFSSPASLTSIVYVGKHQKIPGRLNFRDMLAYGPTKFKGHPLRIRFTVMVLQKDTADQESTAIDIISAIAETAAPQYSAITSDVAKTLKGILKAQPDIAFFDFDATFMSDRPEGLKDIVRTSSARPLRSAAENAEEMSTSPPTTSRTFVAESPTTDEGIGWFHYGRFALLETESHDRKTSAVADLRQTDVYNFDGWLRSVPDRKHLPTSYIIFRVTPGQLDETDEVLRAASESNTALMKTLRRSDAEITEGLKAITDSAADLKLQILRGKAEDLARRIVQNAEANKKDAKAELTAEFPKRWGETISRFNSTDKAAAKTIGDEVLKRWQDKFSA